MIIENKEGLEFLRAMDKSSADLVLTDPPYITSRESGMDKWVDLVERQNQPDAANLKTEEQWEKFKQRKNWEKFFANSDVVDRFAAMHRMKGDYLKYGSIYGTKYAVQTDFGKWDSEFDLETLDSFIRQFYRVLKTGGTCIVFFDIWKLSDLKSMLEGAGFKQLRFIEWIKSNPQPRNSNVNYLTNCREVAITAVKGGKPTFNSKYDKGIYEYPLYSGKDRFHPTQKSLKLFEELVCKHSNAGDLVVDPFLGSGTTAAACKLHDRRFSGCEVDETFFKKTLARLEKL